MDCISRKPKLLSHVDSCALAYASCTVWAALRSVKLILKFLFYNYIFQTAKISLDNAHKMHVLIHGGSGGVGTTAIQMLKAWGVPKVVATCSQKKLL